MGSESNISVVLHKSLDLRIENRKIPAIGPNEVLLQMKRVGICGSDVHFWQNGAIGNLVVESPMILGHESSGVVHEVGSEVKNLKKGDRVAIEPQITCRTCEFCKSGRYNLCPNARVCIVPPNDGSLSQFYKHAADFCFKLPDNVSLEEGAMMEPLSVAVHACRRAGITPGDSVLILGAGSIGLLNMLVAKAMGATRVCITDMSAPRLTVASNLGADETFLVESDDFEPTLKKLTACKCYPNKTIECSGAESALVLGIKATKPGGILMAVGFGETLVTIPLVEASLKEIDIRGCTRYANCYPIALDLVSKGQVKVMPLITHSYRLSESLEAFEMSKSGAGIKVMIKCDQ